VTDTSRTGSLVRALGLDRPAGVVCVVGGGGKSSLMFALARALPGRTVMTTTTRIFAAQMDLAPEVCTLSDAGWRERLDRFETSLLVVGSVEGDRAVGVPPALPAELCAHAGIDQVVVEADGSRMRPVKAPAAHEPVIPDRTGLLVAVAGIDALAGPIREVAHRPERVCAITGLAPEQSLTPDALARLLTSPEGGLKGVPPAARVAVLLNKVESGAQRGAARRVARGVLREPRVERVVLGALQGAAASDWEVCLRVRDVCAGERRTTPAR
jgi:molybdenum cofactor cytidylyltransferase